MNDTTRYWWQANNIRAWSPGAITRAKVNPNLNCHRASLVHNELMCTQKTEYFRHIQI